MCSISVIVLMCRLFPSLPRFLCVLGAGDALAALSLEVADAIGAY